MKSGFVALIGKPNVGKSSILNGLLKQKLAIVTEKAETTRNAIKGIFRDDESEITFIDTPGLFKGKTLLDRHLKFETTHTVRDVDVIVLVIDSSSEFDESFVKLVNPKIPLIVAMNKIDLIRIDDANKLKKKINEIFKNAKIVEMSAIQNFGYSDLIREVKTLLSEGPSYYLDSKEVSDSSIEFYISEIIREKALLLLRQEVPHQLAVKVIEIKDKAKAIVISASIIVSKISHKAIVIGKAGKTIKSIGINARRELEEHFKKRIYLDLFVSVKKDWLNDVTKLKELGYE